MKYDLDSKIIGVQDCPRCRFSMEPLRRCCVLNRDFGYSLDYRDHEDQDDHFVSSVLIGNLNRYFWRHHLEPIFRRWIGDWQSYRYRRVLRAYPSSFICTHCRHIVKRRSLHDKDATIL